MSQAAVCGWVPVPHCPQRFLMNRDASWAAGLDVSSCPPLPWPPRNLSSMVVSHSQAFSSILITTKHHLFSLKGQISMHTCQCAYKGTRWPLNTMVITFFPISSKKPNGRAIKISQSLSTACLNPCLFLPDCQRRHHPCRSL